MLLRILPFAAVTLVLTSFSTSAAIVSGFGATATSQTRDSCATDCNGSRPDQISLMGGEFDTFANSNVAGTSGIAFASAGFGGSAFTPLLGASATTPVNGTTGGTGRAVAIQGYTFTGTVAQDFDLTIELHALTTAGNASSEATASSDFAVFNLGGAQLGGDNQPFFMDFATLVGEVVPEELGGTVLSQGSLFLSAANPDPDDTVETTLNFTLNPGDEVYVYANLVADAQRGGDVDATNTLGMVFDDPTGLEATVTELPPVAAVPVPGAAWMFGSALCLLGLRRR